MTTSESFSSRWRGRPWAVNVHRGRDGADVGAVYVESGAEPGWAPVSALGPVAAAHLGYILVGARAFPWRVWPTYRLFGVNCPFCGLTSGFSEALRGHLERASRRNLAAVPVTAGVLTLSLRWVWEMTR
jgi:hypothetical protein